MTPPGPGPGATGDPAYRLLTLVQMSGVLVLAAGVPSAFNQHNFTTITVGYVVMRVAMIGPWLRAAWSDPEHRPVGLRYVGAIAVVQVGWVARLFLPDRLGTGVVPGAGAGRAGRPALGRARPGPELAPAPHRRALRAVHDHRARRVRHRGRGRRPGERGRGRLERRRHLSFWWGYGHYGIFASLAALGAGLLIATVVAIGLPLPLGVLALALPPAAIVLSAALTGRDVRFEDAGQPADPDPGPAGT